MACKIYPCYFYREIEVVHIAACNINPNELDLVRPLLNVAQTMRQSPSKGHANAESIQQQHAALRQHGSIAWALDINRGLCKARGSSYSKQTGSA